MSITIITQRLSRCISLQSVSKLLGTNQLHWRTVRDLNNNTACITKMAREIYENSFQTVVVEPDGSSYFIRHHKPRQIIKLPLDLATLTEKQRLLHLERRKPKRILKITPEEKDNFKSSKYLDLMKVKKNK